MLRTSFLAFVVILIATQVAANSEASSSDYIITQSEGLAKSCIDKGMYFDFNHQVERFGNECFKSIMTIFKDDKSKLEEVKKNLNVCCDLQKECNNNPNETKGKCALNYCKCVDIAMAMKGVNSAECAAKEIKTCKEAFDDYAAVPIFFRFGDNHILIVGIGGMILIGLLFLLAVGESLFLIGNFIVNRWCYEEYQGSSESEVANQEMSSEYQTRNPASQKAANTDSWILNDYGNVY